MAFTNLLIHTITTKRLTTSTGIKSNYTEVGPFKCFIQPLDDQQTALHGLAMGKAFKCFTDPNLDILASDKVTDQDGVEYTVQGVKNRSYGTFAHNEIILVNEDD